ncbi:MAG: cupin domain-containing protein [Nanoarchaeota archaeon]|nr:cupin domain-containing protein [Nanoarchaeota archaeon]MBU4116632.1 cupin domain-containing protein [Nanoarchaeota archaeon]
MSEPRLIEVYKLPTVDNVCNQILREVISLPKVSMAHVIMNKGNVSLWHQHSKMTEVYFILSGEGVLYYGDKALQAEKGIYLVLPLNTPHKLRNIGKSDLEHLVFAIPPFDPEDVKILDSSPTENIIPAKLSYDKPPITALDGALIYELMNVEEREQLDVALAVGFLPAGRKAIPHYHKISEELYYVTDGFGRVRVGEQDFEVKKGSIIYIPTDKVHALENESDLEELKVLCVSSPSYTEGDFILKNDRN